MLRSKIHCHRSGVTLAETVMVIVLLGMVAVASSFILDSQWSSKRSVATITNEVADSLNAARNSAITNQTRVSVRSVRRHGIAQLIVIEDPGPFSAGETRTIDLGEDIRVGGAPSVIRFNSTGASSRSLRWTIRKSRTVGQVHVSLTDGQVTRSVP